MEIRIPACVLPMRTSRRQRGRDVLSTPTCMTANPLPSFEGEPKKVGISGDIDAFTDLVWNSLNEDNKVSLFVRFIDIAAGTYETRIVNKNK